MQEEARRGRMIIVIHWLVHLFQLMWHPLLLLLIRGPTVDLLFLLILPLSCHRVIMVIITIRQYLLYFSSLGQRQSPEFKSSKPD